MLLGLYAPVTLLPCCSGACTLFATHFSRLAELAAMYPNCKLWHFGVNASAQSERLDYTWKLKAGQQQAVHYGLILANSVGIPEEVICTHSVTTRHAGPDIDQNTVVCIALSVRLHAQAETGKAVLL